MMALLLLSVLVGYPLSDLDLAIGILCTPLRALTLI